MSGEVYPGLPPPYADSPLPMAGRWIGGQGAQEQNPAPCAAGAGFTFWRPKRDSNPCYRLERAAS
jgi:hypothetical protein